MRKMYPTRKDQTFAAARMLCRGRRVVLDLDSGGLGGCGGLTAFVPREFSRGPDGYPEVCGPVAYYVGEPNREYEIGTAWWRAPMADVWVAS